jgi:hypothetical protein
MGSDFRDIDNDGKPDIFVVALVRDTFPLFRNTGGGDFSDMTFSSGIARATLMLTGWGTGMYDLDNDGWKDLLISTGSVLDNAEVVERLPSKLPNLLLRNLNGHKFEDVSAAAGLAFRVPRAHRGAAFADLNNDGKIDVVITVLNEKPEIWLNRSAGSNHWLMLKLTGTKSNRQGLGAKVKLGPEGGTPQYNHATTSVGFATSCDDRVHFGLGSATIVKSIEITWSSGTQQTLSNVKADQILVVTEPKQNGL